MARNDSSYKNIEEINPIVKNADMVKNNTIDNTINNTRNKTSVSDIVKAAEKEKPKYTDTRSRITPYIKTEVLDEFKAICGGKKGLQSEIIEMLLIRFIDEFNKSKK